MTVRAYYWTVTGALGFVYPPALIIAANYSSGDRRIATQ